MSSAGALVKDHAIVLALTPYQEKHFIVQLCTHRHGKISALAMNARNSKKRFGGALQVGHYVIANLHRSNSTEIKMWRLDSVDLKDTFDHLRTSFESIETMSFYLSMIRDLCPEGDVDGAIFVALGRVLRDSQILDFTKHALWSKLALWSWWAHHHGFGDMTQVFAAQLKSAGIEGIWHQILAQDAPTFAELFQVFVSTIEKDLPDELERKMYIDWINASGLIWKHFESLHESERRIFS